MKDKISFGAFFVLADNYSGRLVFGNTDLQSPNEPSSVPQSDAKQEHDRVLRPCLKQPPSMHGSGDDRGASGSGDNCSASAATREKFPAQNSNSKSLTVGPSCFTCLSLGHRTNKCPGRIRCWKCTNFGHTWKRCSSRSSPILMWQPRSSLEGDRIPPRSRVTRVKPNLVWAKAPVSKAADLLNACADPADSSQSLNLEQERCIVHPHPQPQSSPPHPETPTENPTSPAPIGGVPLDKDKEMANYPTPTAVTGLEIVPWKPVLDVLALQLLPAIVESRRDVKARSSAAPAEPVILLGAPPHFEFQSEEKRPSPPVTQGLH